MKKLISLTLVLALAAGLFVPFSVSAAGNLDSLFKNQGHSRRDILQKYTAPVVNGSTYATAPRFSSPYSSGSLTAQAKTNGLNALNFARYLAGIGSNVTLDSSDNQKAMDAAYICAANGTLSHSPAQPADIPDSIYNSGKSGCASANLHTFGSSRKTVPQEDYLVDSILSWLDDSDSSNISALGHRRWILDPKMKTTGFGVSHKDEAVNGFYRSFSSMIAFDSNRSGTNPNVVSWPAAGYFPFDYFDTNAAWSVSLNSSVYSKQNTSNISVTITDNAGNSETLNSSSGTFYINTGNYGTDYCIIFRPNYKTYNNREYHVRITGLAPVSGSVSSTLEYDVCFFSLGTAGLDIKRLGGNSRYATSAVIADEGWDSANTVVLANGLNYADALCGVPLAAYLDAPILLTAGKNSLESEITSEISALHASNIIILGGAGAVSESIENYLINRHYTVKRVSGSTRYETSVEAAKYLDSLKGRKSDNFFAVTGTGYADALSVSPYAGALGDPIIYVNSALGLQSVTKNYISGAQKCCIIGGSGAVSEGISNSISALGIRTERIFGSNRFETCRQIAAKADAELFGSKHDVMLATGMNFPDALAGGVLAAKLRIPLVLTQNATVPAAISSYVVSCEPETIYVCGGEGVIPDSSITNMF